MILFLPSGGNGGGLSPLGEKVFKTFLYGVLVGLIASFSGELLGLSETLTGILLGVPVAVSLIISVVMLEKGE